MASKQLKKREKKKKAKKNGRDVTYAQTDRSLGYNCAVAVHRGRAARLAISSRAARPTRFGSATPRACQNPAPLKRLRSAGAHATPRATP